MKNSLPIVTWNRDDAIAIGVLFAFTLTLYRATVCPVLYAGDSGELITAAATLGVPHPPGYPVYTYLGYLWLKVMPFENVAFSMNMLSAACGATSVVLIYSLLRRLPVERLIAFGVSLIFGLGLSFWDQATVARVYTLSLLTTIGLLILTIDWIREGRSITLDRFAWLAGFSIATHYYAVIPLTLFLVVALIYRRAESFKPQRIAHSLIRILPGLATFLTIPLRSFTDPPIDWGNVETPAAFWDFISRKIYRERVWVQNPYDVMAVWSHQLRQLPTEFGWIAALLIGAGLWLAIKRHRPLALMGGGLWVINLLFLTFQGAYHDLFSWHRNMLVGSVGLMMSLALALQAIHARLIPLTRDWPTLSQQAIGISIVLILPMRNLFVNYSKSDKSQNYLAYDFNRSLLQSLPSNAVLIGRSDNVLFGLVYLQKIEGLRPDVMLVQEGIYPLAQLVVDTKKRSLFVSHYNEMKNNSVSYQPYGLAAKIVAADSPRQPETSDWSLIERSIRNLHDRHLPDDYDSRELLIHYHFMNAMGHLDTDPAHAYQALLTSNRIGHDNEVYLYNSSYLYQHLGLLHRARQVLMASLDLNWHYDSAVQELAKLRFKAQLTAAQLSPEARRDFEQQVSLAKKALARAKPAAAIRSLRNAGRLAPGEAMIYNNLGVAFIQEKQFDFAKEALLSALLVDPHYTVASENLQRLETFTSTPSIVSRR